MDNDERPPERRDDFDRGILDEGNKVLAGRWSEAGEWVVTVLTPAADENTTD